MSLFTEKANPDTKVGVVKALVPKVYITSEALAKMQIFVQECSDEIGWLGTAKSFNDGTKDILISDVYLFDQEVHSTTTEITANGLAAFGEAILEREDGVDIWNNLKVWGHSHVNMGVTPSGQDDAQMETFAKSGHDWFIRLIANKRGEMKIDFYDYTQGIVFFDMPWFELVDDELVEIQSQISILQKQLDDMAKKHVDALSAPIKEEMSVKVRKKTYQYQYNKSTTYTGQTNSSTVGTVTGTEKDKKDSRTSAQIDDWWERKKKENKEDKEETNAEETDDKEMEETFWTYFDAYDLQEIIDCTTLSEVRHYTRHVLGYVNFFTDSELLNLWIYAKNFYIDKTEADLR